MKPAAIPAGTQQSAETPCAACRETWTYLRAMSSPTGLSSSNGPLTALCSSTLWQSSLACNLILLAGDSACCDGQCAPLAIREPDGPPHAELAAHRPTG